MKEVLNVVISFVEKVVEWLKATLNRLYKFFNVSDLKCVELYNKERSISV